MEIKLPNVPDTSDVLVPPKTIFYPPVAEIPYLDPLLLPSLEQVQSGLGEDQAAAGSSKKGSSSEEELNTPQEEIPLNLPKNLENNSTIETVGTFNIPFFGEMPIPAPEVIASSVIASGVSATAAIGGSIILQSIVNQLKKVMTKIFKKVLKKEVANVKEKLDNKKGS